MLRPWWLYVYYSPCSNGVFRLGSLLASVGILVFFGRFRDFVAGLGILRVCRVILRCD